MSLVFDYADIAARMKQQSADPVKDEAGQITLSLNVDSAALAKALADQSAMADDDMGIWCFGICIKH